MKKLLFLLFVYLFTITACQDEENPITADFHYDGENVSAPFLEPGVWEAAARFPSSTTSEFQGKSLEEVEFYILERPDACALHIYGEGTDRLPGNLLYSASLTNGINANSWHIHPLDTPLPITGEDLWITIIVTHNSEMASVGCDDGPANNDGDWTYFSEDGEWFALRTRTGNQVNINWNIRGYVGE